MKTSNIIEILSIIITIILMIIFKDKIMALFTDSDPDCDGKDELCSRGVCGSDNKCKYFDDGYVRCTQK